MDDMVLTPNEAKRLYEMLKEANGAAIEMRKENDKLHAELASLQSSHNALREAAEGMEKALNEWFKNKDRLNEEFLGNTLERNLKESIKAFTRWQSSQAGQDKGDGK